MFADYLWLIKKLKNSSPSKRIYLFKKFSTREGDTDEKGAVQFSPNTANFVIAIALDKDRETSTLPQGKFGTERIHYCNYQPARVKLFLLSHTICCMSIKIVPQYLYIHLGDKRTMYRRLIYKSRRQKSSLSGDGSLFSRWSTETFLPGRHRRYSWALIKPAAIACAVIARQQKRKA